MKDIRTTKFAGICPQCDCILSTWHELWKDCDRPEAERRMECPKCTLVFKKSLMKKRIKPKYIRTLFPWPTYNDMVEEFKHLINLFGGLKDEFILERKNFYLSHKQIHPPTVFQAIKDAANRSNWNDNEYLAMRVRHDTGRRPFPMIEQKKRSIME